MNSLFRRLLQALLVALLVQGAGLVAAQGSTASPESLTESQALRYTASYGDLIRAFGIDTAAAARHYQQTGRAEGRQLSFDGLRYIASYGDLIVAFGTDVDAATRHYISRGALIEGRKLTFDALRYVATYGDLISSSGTDTVAATKHYIQAGYREGRSPKFDAVQYLSNYRDLQLAYGSDTRLATLHYINYGYKEGRSAAVPVMAAPDNRDTGTGGSTTSGGSATVAASVVGYYVDAVAGSDTNPGTFDRPWRSLAKLTAVRLKTGDSIFLKCGSLWRESLALGKTQLVDGNTIAGYGSNCSSTKPVISGAIPLQSGWVKTGNFWVRDLPAGTARIKRLFIDNLAHRQARWPNFTGYSSSAAVSDTTVSTFSSSTAVKVASTDRWQLMGKDLVGAEVNLRSKPWLIEARSVTSYAPADGSLTVGKSTTYPLLAGSGYSLQGKFWMLDVPGEFFHDVAQNKLYVYPATAALQANMNSAVVEAGVRDSALAISGRAGLVVKDLMVTMSSGHGLALVDTPNVKVSNVIATRNGQSGITLAIFDSKIVSNARSTVSGNLLTDNWVYGIEATHMPRTDIQNNTILDTGVGDNAGGSHSAISVGESGTASGNTIKNTAYLGISFSGTGGTVVRENSISGYCTVMSDCGAIYTWNGPKASRRTSNQSSTVESNQIQGAVANTRGATGNGAEVVVGVYLDDYSQGSVVRGNWISGVPMGVFLHNASSNTVSQNKIWLSSRAGLWASMDQSDYDYLTGNVFSDNEIIRVIQASGSFPTLPSYKVSNAVWFWHQLYGSASLSAGSNMFRSNRQVELNGVTSATALVRSGRGEQFLSSAEWRALNASEPKAVSPMVFGLVNAATGGELLRGGLFDGGMSPWSSWFTPIAARGSARYLAGAAGCSGGCAELTASTPQDMLFSPPFAMTAGVPHVFRYAASFGAAATLATPYISRTVYPWDSFASAAGYVSLSSLNGTAGSSGQYEGFFVPKSNEPAQINIQLRTMGAPVAFDNVSVKAVSGFSYSRPEDWIRVVHAPRDTHLVVGCADLGWGSSCSVTDTAGVALALPVRVGAGTSLALVRADSAWRR